MPKNGEWIVVGKGVKTVKLVRRQVCTSSGHMQLTVCSKLSAEMNCTRRQFEKVRGQRSMSKLRQTMVSMASLPIVIPKSL